HHLRCVTHLLPATGAIAGRRDYGASVPSERKNAGRHNQQDGPDRSDVGVSAVTAGTSSIVRTTLEVGRSMAPPPLISALAASSHSAIVASGAFGRMCTTLKPCAFSSLSS